jgi:hypothetical protein
MITLRKLTGMLKSAKNRVLPRGSELHLRVCNKPPLTLSSHHRNLKPRSPALPVTPLGNRPPLQPQQSNSHPPAVRKSVENPGSANANLSQAKQQFQTPRRRAPRPQTSRQTTKPANSTSRAPGTQTSAPRLSSEAANFKWFARNEPVILTSRPHRSSPSTAVGSELPAKYRELGKLRMSLKGWLVKLWTCALACSRQRS